MGAAHTHERPRGGPVVLDIGGEIGALIASVEAEASGTELYIRSEVDPAVRVHTGVWQRGHDGGVITVAVFPEVPVGAYWVLDGDERDVCRVVVRGGEVTTVDLRR